MNTLFESRDLLVIDKPSHRSLLADRDGSVSLLDELQQQYGRLFIVHRLDKGTSGALALARTVEAQSNLTRAFTQRRVRKFYLADILGSPQLVGTGKIELPLKPGRKSRYRVAGPRDTIQRQANQWRLEPDPLEGHAATTFWRMLSSSAPDHSRVLLQPVTGRTHQLRVHLAWIGHPILGDHLYGKPKDPRQQRSRLHLHCHKLILPGYGVMRAPFQGVFTDSDQRAEGSII